MDKSQVAVIGAGSVEYDIEKAAVEIDAFIAMLEEMKEDGAQFVVASSGNWRGAQWARMSSDWSWADEE
jgi:hypothetical protein